MQLTFGKHERLSGRNDIDNLFKSGQSFSQYPLRIVYNCYTEEIHPSPVRILVSVPKRKFKRAVERNRLKRQIRESYRKNKKLITDHGMLSKRINIAFIYIGDEADINSLIIEQSMIAALDRLVKLVG